MMHTWGCDENFLHGKGALVTGASRGIGQAIALALAAAGAGVALSARDAGRLEQVADQIRATGRRAFVLPADMTQEEQLIGLVDQAQAALGRLDILVNNAGAGLYGPLEHFSTADWDTVMAVNVRAPFILSRQAIAPMRRNGGGTIINISSVVGIKAYENQGAYTASKHALMGLSKVLAQEVQTDGIRVHTICPGGVDTGMAAQSRPDLDRSILISPQAVAQSALFLLALGGNAAVDDIHLRRANGQPSWY